MAERVVYLNGQDVAERAAKVPVLDRGFRWGVERRGPAGATR
jgi:hypothetical protein